MMEVLPIRKYRGPVYPTHDDIDGRPDLLANVPARWQTNPAVLTALASVTMLSTASAAMAVVVPDLHELFVRERRPLPATSGMPAAPQPRVSEHEARRAFIVPDLVGLCSPPVPDEPPNQRSDTRLRENTVSVRPTYTSDPRESVAELIIRGPERVTDWNALAPENRATAFSGEQLRAQVRDFVQWLKAQGII